MMDQQELFTALNGLNVNDKTEKKNGLTYLSWAWAWQEFKRACPDATYEVVTYDGRPYYYDPNTGYMVYTRVMAAGVCHEMWLPVMDGANRAMKDEPYSYCVKNPNFRYAKKMEDGKYYDKYGNEQKEWIERACEAATMFDINKAIMRCLTKNLAMFGLGLYIYAGEDLPEDPNGEQNVYVCESCGKPFEPYTDAGGKTYTAKQQYEAIKAKSADGVVRCAECRKLYGGLKNGNG